MLRDGAAGATRWAFATLLLKLAREGHCTIVRSRGRRWVRRTTVLRVEPHMDPRSCSALEKTILRQFARHDTLSGFGFAGSTFRRRTLRDVREQLIRRGELSDRRTISNALLAAGLLFLVASLLCATGGAPVVGATAGGLGVGGVGAAVPRCPLTRSGARRLAQFRTYARDQKSRLEAALNGDPSRAASLLMNDLPTLVLARFATPRWLRVVSRRLEEAPVPMVLNGCRDETGTVETAADACRVLAVVLEAMGAGWFRPDRW